MSERYDLVVIGGGPAGEKGAAKAAYWGKSVCLIEAAAEPGGAAVHTGTLPSKTLRETALYLSGYRNRELYGISVSLDRSATVPHLIERKTAIEEAESARIRYNLERHGVTYVHGFASFSDSGHVRVIGGERGDRVIAADRFLITTGSLPRRPADLPMDHTAVDDSDTILSIRRLPDALTVIGGGVIGCEYACMFAALGVHVTVVDPRVDLLPFLDRELVERLQKAMVHLGVRFRQGVRYQSVEPVEGGPVRCVLSDGTSIDCDRLLFAAGRVGNTQRLGLEALGIEVDKRGYIPVNEHFQTAVPTIYAAGDVVGFPALASTSMEQGRTAVSHAFDLPYKAHVSALQPYGIYTIPEVSGVGLTEEDCVEKGIPYVVGRARYSENARGQIAGDLLGLTKLVVHAEERRIIGAHVIGDRAAELIHIGQLAIITETLVDTLIEMVFNYPTLSESYKYAAYDALGALDRLS